MTVGAATQLAYPSQPPASPTAGASFGTTVTIQDAGGNTVTGASVAWSSSNAAVATVNATSGLIAGVSPGSATITATAGGKSDQLVVRVLASVALVEVTAPDSSVFVGTSIQATVVLKDANGNALSGRPIAWSSSNASVATVSASGLIAAVGAGSANITVTVPAEGATGSMPFSVSLVPAAHAFVIEIDKAEMLKEIEGVA